MGKDFDTAAGRVGDLSNVARHVRHELAHMQSHWWWLMLLGGLLAICGTAAIVVPHLTVLTTLAMAALVGVLLMVGGAATIVGAFWAGRWSGLLVQLLVGILYLAAGFIITEHPGETALAMTIFVAVSFVVMGTFRTVAALQLRYPQWGWSVLNGVITMLAGIVIYRQLPFDAFWVIGLLVGLEMLFNGWMWIMLSMAIRQLPVEAE
jgi:uncharacterized membrane protein HdeD (DUF308 family)